MLDGYALLHIFHIYEMIAQHCKYEVIEPYARIFEVLV